MCGGEVTEPGYFDGLKRAFRNPAVQVCVKKKGIDPVSLVEHAAVIRDRDSDTFDEVWCVVDVDDFDLASAVHRSDDRGIQLAVSNPCFEVWLLLHFIDCTSVVRDAIEAERRLKKHVPDYSKKEFRFERFGDGVTDAIRRARGLEHLGNPSSGVWMVAETIVGY